MSIFVDTSALLTILDAAEQRHEQAHRVWIHLLDGNENLVSTNYVLVETIALAQNRLGLASVAALQQDVVPALAITWIDEAVHESAVGALLTAGRRRLSLVDCTSFEIMRRLGIRQVFAFDPHFAEQGFECLPTAAQNQ